jgi:Mrp family chromosome partitioning ATPase
MSAEVLFTETPPQFAELYATLECQVGGAEGRALLDGNVLGRENCYAIGITSAVAGEGKSTIALHLAMTAARSSVNRLGLLDLSLGRRDLGAPFCRPFSGTGVIQALESGAPEFDTIILEEWHGLVLMPAGRAPAHPAKLARSPRIASVIEQAREKVDVLVVDLPAVASNNALPLARHLDAVVMVACAGATPTKLIGRALDHLGRDRVLGVVLNRVKVAGPAWLQRRFAFR